MRPIALAFGILCLLPLFAIAEILEGTVVKIADVDTITVLDSAKQQQRITSGKATSYPPPPPKEEESPEVVAKRRKDALHRGPYKVEIMRRCLGKGFECLPGEVISLDENDALCLATFSGRIVDSPPKEETIEEMVRRMIEEQLQKRAV